MTGLELSRTTNTVIQVNRTVDSSKISVAQLLEFADLLRQAVDAGMPGHTEVKIDTTTTRHKTRLHASCSLTKQLPPLPAQQEQPAGEPKACKVSVESGGGFIGRQHCKTHDVYWDNRNLTCPAAAQETPK